MKPRIFNDITNIFAKLAGSADYDPRVKYDTALEYYANQVPVLPNPGTNNTGKVVAAKADGNYELKTVSTGDSNAVHYTADTGKTDEQKAQARSNIGALGADADKTFKVTFTITYLPSLEISCDKTLQQISDAYFAGKLVYANVGDFTYILESIDTGDGICSFVAVTGEYLSIIYMPMASDEWLMRSGYIQMRPTVVNVSGATPTIAEVGADTIYECGELTSLTITTASVYIDFIIRFTSGATPTTTSFPASMKFPEAFAAEANMRYEISVSNGYALVASWPVS